MTGCVDWMDEVAALLGDNAPQELQTKHELWFGPRTCLLILPQADQVMTTCPKRHSNSTESFQERHARRLTSARGPVQTSRQHPFTRKTYVSTSPRTRAAQRSWVFSMRHRCCELQSLLHFHDIVTRIHVPFPR